MAAGVSAERSSSLRKILVPLALAQFICSFAGSNMNVMINDMSKDLDTTVEGIQTAITVFLLVMAALMIPAGKLTDRWGRKRCFSLGLIATAISWRAAFVFQALVIAVIVLLSRSIVDPVAADPTRPFDSLGAVLSAVGLVLVVMGILQADTNLVLMAVLVAAGADAGLDPSSLRPRAQGVLE